MSNDNSTLDYFEHYRGKRRELAELHDEINGIKKLIEQKKFKYGQLNDEIRSMRRIITAMIDNDMDPVEVKLRNELGDLTQSMWSDDPYYGQDTVTLTIAGATGATGANSITGALGATGSYHAHVSSPPSHSHSILTTGIYSAGSSGCVTP